MRQKTWAKIEDMVRGMINLSILNQTHCDKCGCVVVRSMIIEGMSEVREEDVWSTRCIIIGCHKEKYIHTPKYCRRCAKEV